MPVDTPAPQTAANEECAPQPRRARWFAALWHLTFVALVYVPILQMQPGKIEADTKVYLYIDPGRFLKRAASLWDPNVAMGTLSHQTIGYLFPMGPYYWVTSEIGIPAWVSQRLWLATMIVAAGYGMRYVLRTLGVSGPGIGVAMVAFAFTPYVLGYTAIESALLLPWAALPWWLGYAERSLERDAWKYAALFAITVQIAGSVNGSSLLFALIGPVLWVLHAAVFKRTTWGRAWAVTWRSGLLTFLTSLWWFIPLLIEGKYGINILRFTESVQTVATTSQPYEILRGLGNWYFYGTNRLGAWVDARPYYTQRVGFVFVSYAVPAMALLAAAVLRWRHRAYFVFLSVLAVVVAVGASPYNDPSLVGGVYKNLALHHNIVFAFRNVGRIMPLLSVSVAALLGVAVSAFVQRMRAAHFAAIGWTAAGLVLAACVTNAYPALAGQYYSKFIEFSKIPTYWHQAIAKMDSEPHTTRVLALPGSDFASYRWGDTREPIEPGLMSRPFAARELVAWGTAPTVNLLRAVDHRVQESSLEPAALAPMARLMGVGDVEIRSDLEGDRYSLVPPGQLWATIGDPPAPGFDKPLGFGKATPQNSLAFSELGDLTLPASQQPKPPAVAVMPVKNPLPIERTEPAADAMVVDGDAEGLVDLASAGLLDPARPVLYSAPYEKTPAKLAPLAGNAVLVDTDSNRRRGQRWSGLHDDFGYTEQAGEKPLVEDPTDQRLDPFQSFGAGDEARTVTDLSGVKSVRATTYGDPGFSYSPANRPAAAFDGDVKTAWTVDSGENAQPERLQMVLTHPITTDHINLVQFSGKLLATQSGPTRYISAVTLTFDGKTQVHAKIARSSTNSKGQTITFPKRTFTTLELRIDQVTGGRAIEFATLNPVGFSEIRVGDDQKGAKPIRVGETEQLPSDMLHEYGTASATHPLLFVLSRESTMDGATLNRRFWLPSARTFSFTGTGHLSATATDDALDRAFSLPDSTQPGGITAVADARLGAPVTRASSAFDGDLRSAWQTPVGAPLTKMHFTVHDPISFDHLDLLLMADGRHSLPTSLQLKADKKKPITVNVPLPKGNKGPGNVMSVHVTFPKLTGKTFEVTIEGDRDVEVDGNLMPVGIAELGVPGVRRAPSPSFVPETCYSDIVTLDGKPLSVKFSGTVETALKQKPLTMSLCDPADAPRLAAGYHTIKIKESPHNPDGFDVNRVVLASDAQDRAADPKQLTATPPAPPAMTIAHSDATSTTAHVQATSSPFWFVLGESYSTGWTAKVNGHSLGAPQLVNGFANGWRITPTGKPMTLTIEWTPERSVRIALWLSAIAGLACIAIVGFALLRRRRTPIVASDAEVAFHHRTPVHPGAVAWVAASTGVIGAVAVRPWVGLVVALATLAAGRWPWLRTTVRYIPAAIASAIALYVPWAQYTYRYPPRFDWSTFFKAATIPAWIAVLLLLADVMLYIGAPDERASGP